jgi:hypothetical protein
MAITSPTSRLAMAAKISRQAAHRHIRRHGVEVCCDGERLQSALMSWPQGKLRCLLATPEARKRFTNQMNQSKPNR